MSSRTHPTAAEATQPLPPSNTDAEESILGAMMLSPRAIDDVAQIVDAADFYRGSHAKIYRAALALHQLGQPVDAITVADRLDELGQLTDVGGTERIHEIAALVPAASNAGHYARIVVEMAQLRQLTTVGEQIQRLAWDRDGSTVQLLEQARELLATLDARTGAATALHGGHTHAQVLDLQLPVDRYLIDDLIPAGAVGTIAAVPEAHKSWLAQAIAIRVARGHGYILGKEVTHQGRVAYLWQDDSTAEEAERIKAFEKVHPTDPQGDTPVDWYLNTGVQLPRDIGRLRATVEAGQHVLLILDSYYNFLPGIDLKDEQAEQIVALLKREISDPTGCTVLIVDHMPWATEMNRGRLRAYGGVFKNAATRFGIYIDVTGDKLHIEARGNNIRGIPKRLAYWDPDHLELRLLNTDDVDRDDLVTARMQDVRKWLEANAGAHTTRAVRDAVGGSAALTGEALEALLAEGVVLDQDRKGENHSGQRGSARYWIASIHAPQRYPQVVPEPLWNQSEPLDGDPGPDRGEKWFSETQEPLRTTPPDDPGPHGGKVVLGDLIPPVGGGAREPLEAAATTTGSQTGSDAEQWMRSDGWMHDDPAAALIDRWPMLPLAEIKRLTILSGELAADVPVETPDLMEGE